MDFSNRGNQSSSSSTSSSPAAPRPGSSFPSGDSKLKEVVSDGAHIYKLIGVAAIILAVLAAAVLGVLFTAKQARGEEALIDASKMQAVFLTNDQVYFGKIVDISAKSMVLTDIYYLQTSGTGTNAQTSNNSNVSLIKLGCELHQPTDNMIINREQVQFWENLKKDGQVAQAVEKFKKDNPNGQTCTTATGTGTGATGNVQGSGAAGTGTGGTTNQSTNQ